MYFLINVSIQYFIIVKFNYFNFYILLFFYLFRDLLEHNRLFKVKEYLIINLNKINLFLKIMVLNLFESFNFSKYI
jgi:hypothetical protein